MVVSMVAPQLDRFDLWVQPLSENSDDANVLGFLKMLAAPLQATTNGAPLPNVVSVSYGECESDVSPYSESRTLVERTLAAEAALGITVVVAAGDTGSSACARGVKPNKLTSADKKPQLSWPASSPYVLAVGGTNLTLNSDNSIASTGTWNDTAYPAPFTATKGGGGGQSTFESRPWWQPEQSFANSSKRMVPDIAAFADESPGYAIVCSSGVKSCPNSPQQGITFVGGTSAATPLVAGMIALWAQQAKQQGLPKPGFVPPLLYARAKSNPERVHRHHTGNQRPVRRIVLPRPAGLRPGDRARLAHGESDRRPTGRLTAPMSIAWATAIIVAVAAGAIAAMLLVRRRAPEGSYFEDGDRAAGVFGVLATGFAVLAGFVVFLAFESYDTSRNGAEAEARIVAEQFETVQFLPTRARERISGELVCYARSVVHLEWPRMESGTLDDALNPWGVAVFRSLRGTEPRSASEQAAFSKYLDQRSDREDARSDRTHGGEGVIPAPLWIVLFLSAAILFAFMLFFADSGERAFVQATMMGGVAVLVSSLLLLLWFLDNPFHGGSGSLQPVAMERTLDLLKQEANVVGGVEPPCDPSGSPTRA